MIMMMIYPSRERERERGCGTTLACDKTHIYSMVVPLIPLSPVFLLSPIITG